jgi:hypothetical protein
MSYVDEIENWWRGLTIQEQIWLAAEAVIYGDQEPTRALEAVSRPHEWKEKAWKRHGPLAPYRRQLEVCEP